MCSVNNISKRFALILIDPQNGFINDGYWSRMFSKDQTIPILNGFDRIVLFLRSISNPESIPILISQTGFSSHDQQIYEPILNELSQRKFLSITYTYKPHTNLSICPGVRQWLSEQLENQLDIVIGGCTITSCVRDSSIHMKKLFPQLNFIVDKNLCAARKDNYIQRCEKCLENYMIDGSMPVRPCEICLTKQNLLSPIEIAYQQMKDVGINVVEKFL